LYELFREVAGGDRPDAGGFCKLVAKHSNDALNEADIKLAFAEVCKKEQKPSAPGVKDYLTWQEFERALTLLIPDP